MKEEGKLIKIDPQMFSFSSSKNKTNKNPHKSTPSGSIRIKTKPKQKKDTLKKQSLLKMIRHHQEDKYKQLFDKKTVNTDFKPESETQKFNTSFEESKNYLANLMTEQDNTIKPIPKNKTLKDRTNLLNNATSNSPFKLDLSNINNTTNAHMPIITLEPNLEFTEESNQIETNPIFNVNQKPEYGCLKGGSLPTYRNVFNKTKKNINNIFGSGPPPSSSDIKNRELIEKHHKQNNYSSIHRQNKRKRIQRRTYKTGKSLKIPKITVLVSNKTIRNNTNLRMLKIKELPILQVKKELIKRGLIRVGTITPNDLLRKMYETVQLLCGDVQNYNTDNLLYNFINDK